MRLIALLAALCLPIAATAQSMELAHQGRLNDANGSPIEGTVTIEVALYTQLDSGTPIWSRSYANTPVNQGYYALTLADATDGTAMQDALFGQSGDIYIEVTAGGSVQSPRQKLASVPQALVSRSVQTPGTTITPEGGLMLRTTDATGCSTVGELAYHTGLQSVLVCNGSELVSVARRTVVTLDGVRRWSDLSSAASCEQYRRPTGGVYAGDVGSGIYRIDPDGSGTIDVYCDMETDGGGWTLVMNLSSNAGGRKDYTATGFWTGTALDGAITNALTSDFKSDAFNLVPAQGDMMVYVHDQGTTEYGYAIYPLLPAHQSKTMFTLMNSGNNFVPVSDASERVVTQPIGTVRNTHRNQSLHGDIFIDHAGALSLNDTSGWNADQNHVRIATTLSNGDYVHTFAGLGIDHIEGSWGGYFESAPISAYCAVENGYGGSSQGGANGQSSYPYQTSCTTDDGATFAFLSVDHAIFVR